MATYYVSDRQSRITTQLSAPGTWGAGRRGRGVTSPRCGRGGDGASRGPSSSRGLRWASLARPPARSRPTRWRSAIGRSPGPSGRRGTQVNLIVGGVRLPVSSAVPTNTVMRSAACPGGACHDTRPSRCRDAGGGYGAVLARLDAGAQRPGGRLAYGSTADANLPQRNA